MRRLCVFCGSNAGRDPAYRALAAALGQFLARQGIGIVYGGGRVGLMGALANAALAAGGEVIGVIPQALVDREIGHSGLTELRVVESMHERKALMAELADGFVARRAGASTQPAGLGDRAGSHRYARAGDGQSRPRLRL